MVSKRCRKGGLAGILVLAAWAAPLHADPFLALADGSVVDDETLSQQRGGFFSQSGLHLHIGLEQEIRLNGEVVHQSVIRLSEAAGLDRATLQNLELVTGIGPAMAPDIQGALSNSGQVWVGNIQNTLDNQSIERQTTMNIDLTGIAIPSSDLSRAMRQQTIDTVGTR